MWPICGDGLTLQILHTKAGSAMPEILMSRRHPPGSHEKPQRQKVGSSPLMAPEATLWELHMTLLTAALQQRIRHKTLFGQQGVRTAYLHPRVMLSVATDPAS